MKRKGGRWVGWSGNISANRRPSRSFSQDVEYLALDLGEGRDTELHADYVNGALWPILHSRPDLMHFNEASWSAFLRFNDDFAHLLAKQIGPRDRLWVQDYHLIPLAERLESMRVVVRCGFFLHVPFPRPETMIRLPRHGELLDKLAAFELIGVQTPQDLERFTQYLQSARGARVAGVQQILGKDRVLIEMPDGRSFRAAAYPISIDTRSIEESAPAAGDGASVRRLATSLGGSSLVLGVDRLDYSKGLEERFDAYRCFLEAAPARVDECTFVQIAPLSRAEIPAYRQLRNRLDRQVGRINGSFSRPDRTALRYVNRSFSQRTLYGFYRLARVALVTPLCDGMNLVAKEFIACQDPRDPGVLVLSRHAGAANELGDALIVDPLNRDEVCAAIETALAMPLAERVARWSMMIDQLRRRDVHAWADDFLGDLAESRWPDAVPATVSRANPSQLSAAASAAMT
ncbi:trehalose-6-phosphate synthase [Lysobacter sp. H23M47]|uniref:alpha,alpha-trehalose-phosphate synthase (UDP-forming) n=1 Tax=Lysobacter sp. H23M47 TaxID=2781024 RepID=UPI00187FE4B8|nr:trehalose-6-phosphate synthase [Lysobacter sp. H23M47]QOW24428.1 trehalose-6-phosphate synthase [Lysobacter sp. H23M47]